MSPHAYSVEDYFTFIITFIHNVLNIRINQIITNNKWEYVEDQRKINL